MRTLITPAVVMKKVITPTIIVRIFTIVENVKSVKKMKPTIKIIALW
jgi:hypothetical protein